MTLRLRPGVKVRPQQHSALHKYVGYISETPSVIPNGYRVWFPDFDLELTFGEHELDMYCEPGVPLTSYFTGTIDEKLPSPKEASPWPPGDPQWDYAGELLNPGEQRDPGDENDYDAEGAYPEDIGFWGPEDPYANRDLHEGDDFVQEVNEHGNGFHAEFTVDDEGLLSPFVQFDFSYLAGEKEAKHIGVILTPDAAYALAERLLDYAEIAEANS